MQSDTSPASLHPGLLPPGTQVGPWRVVNWAGRGVNGVVYRAVRAGQERLPPVALKVAVVPEDPRYGRERELLSRSLHPHIPRWVDSGYWVSPSGERYPFTAMEWIDGVPLYDWARMFLPSAAQQLRLLAQVALALQYLHAQDALHRDLKGGNILVRRSDSRVFLMDFGSSIYPGADSLTPQQLPPGTPAYRSPEAWLFTQRNRHASERYRAGPADDVYALGVTACVLATGQYPEMGELRKDTQGQGYLDALKLPRALFSARVAPLLREQILYMLTLDPEERPTAGELAPELEQAADSLAHPPSLPSASRPEPAAVLPSKTPASRPRAPVHPWWRWSARVAAAGALALWAAWVTRATLHRAPERPPRALEPTHRADGTDSPEAGPVGLGEAAASPEVPAPSSSSEPLAGDTPPEPEPGQAQPDKKGRCAHPRQVVLNGVCWRLMEVKPEECETFNGQMYQGACYVPLFPPGTQRRPNTSGYRIPK